MTPWCATLHSTRRGSTPLLPLARRWEKHKHLSLICFTNHYRIWLLVNMWSLVNFLSSGAPETIPEPQSMGQGHPQLGMSVSHTHSHTACHVTRRVYGFSILLEYVSHHTCCTFKQIQLMHPGVPLPFWTLVIPKMACFHHLSLWRTNTTPPPQPVWLCWSILL